MIQLHLDLVTESANHWAHISVPCPKSSHQTWFMVWSFLPIEIHFVGRTLQRSFLQYICISSGIHPIRTSYEDSGAIFFDGSPLNCYLQISQFSLYILEYTWILVACGRIVFLKTVQSCIRHWIWRHSKSRDPTRHMPCTTLSDYWHVVHLIRVSLLLSVRIGHTFAGYASLY